MTIFNPSSPTILSTLQVKEVYNNIELFVKNNADTKLSSIAVQFGISKGYAGLILKKLGFSYKKKAFPTWRQTLKSEKNI